MKKNINSRGRKKSQGSFKSRVLSVFESSPFTPMNYKQVAGRMGIHDMSSRELVMQTLNQLVQSGDIIEHKKGKYRINPGAMPQEDAARKVIAGRVDMKPSGKAFIISDEVKEDVFVSPGNTNRAIDGDKVKVMLFPQRRGHKLEGQIVEIIERSREQFAGTLQTGKYYSFFIPDSASVPLDILIPNDALLKAKDGDKVIVRITEWLERSGNPVGEVVAVLGRPGTHEVEMKSILVDYGFPLRFPEAVEKEADMASAHISESEIAKRRDFREVFTLTIDPEDAKDFDDAISLRRLENGNWEAGVHIADVSHYVKPGSQVDREAFQRGTSVYLVDRTIPMLPEILSNQLCSLQPKTDKLCFAAIFEMDEKANIINEWFGKTVINSNVRFNYDEVQQIIESGKGSYANEILILNRLAMQLREDRFRNGSIAFDTVEVKFRLDETGKPLGAYIKEYKDSNKLIEDFMLLANRRVAEFVAKIKQDKKARTFVYRIHDMPNPEKLTQFSEFIAKLGYHIKTSGRKGISRSFNDLFSKIRGTGEENLISNLAVRTMAKAVYSTGNIGHYGLGFQYYTHFTSPIRRYPDLMVHRMLEAYQEGKPSFNKDEYEEYCKHCSDMERRATDAERASVKYKQVEYMLDKVGREFEGLISGIGKWGIYVELLDTKCEGMVNLRDMNDDYYYIDEENYMATGQMHGKQLRLGDKVTIKVKKIDLSRKTMDFMFV